MIKFLIILSIMWGLVSLVGWVNLYKTCSKCRYQYQINRIAENFHLWTLIPDALCIAFWIWLAL